MPTDPSASGRTAFSEVFLEERLRKQVQRINQGPNGRSWLDEQRISQAVGALSRIAAPGLLEANQQATELLLSGITVEGLPGWNGGRDQRVHFIDWENPARNDFAVVSQFRVDIPGTQGRRCIVPDEVLFVNGIPLVLVECKKPGVADRRGDQPAPALRRPAGRRGARGQSPAVPHHAAAGGDLRRRGRPRLGLQPSRTLRALAGPVPADPRRARAAAE